MVVALIDTKTLTQAVTLLTKVAAKGSGRRMRPELGAIVFDLSTERFPGSVASASNLELGAEYRLPWGLCKVYQSSRFAVDAGELKKILPKPKDCEDVVFRLDRFDGMLYVEVDGAEYGLDLIDVERHPSYQWEKEHAIGSSLATFDAGDFAEAVLNCEPHTDPDSTRYALGGILIEAENENAVNFVATDGRRLLVERIEADFARTFAAMAWTEGADSEKNDERIILDAGYGKLIAQALAKGRKGPLGDDQVELIRLASRRVRLEDKQGGITEHRVDQGIALRSGPVTFRVLLTAGRFPNWRAVRPSGFEGRHRIQLEAANAAMARALKVVDKENRGVHLAASEASLMIGVDSPTKANTFRYWGKLDAVAENQLHAEFQIDLDAEYLADALKAAGKLGASEVRCAWIDHKSPFVIESDAPGRPRRSTQAFVMPLRKDR